MRRAIISAASGRDWLNIASITWPRMLDYAVKHGADFIASSPEGHRFRQFSWLKLPAIAKSLCEYDEVLWLDADVFVQEFDRSIFEEATLGGDFHHAMCRLRCESLGDHYNCGVWLCRRGLMPAIVMAAMEDDCVNHPWWEQAAIARQLADFPVAQLEEGWNHWKGSSETIRPLFRHACGLHGRGEQLEKVVEWLQA